MRLLLLPIILLTFLFSLANFAFAQIEITEIMYDLEGTDSKHEWIEIYNNGSSGVTLSNDWRFNDGKNHMFAEPPENGGQGSLTIPSDTYAIIASDATTFVADNSGFSGTVIDTVMSLNNTADTLQIKDANGVVVSEISYDNTMGANGDGNSLQKINGNWTAVAPTPGTENSAGSSSQSGQQSNNSQSQSGGVDVWIEDNNKISADAGKDKTVIVGADTVFTGKAYGIKNEPIKNARYIWNFGDGATREGESVFHNFQYPGEYIVFLDASSGKYSSTSRIRVKAIPSNLSISSVNFSNNSYIEIYNSGGRELDISFWHILSGKNSFTIPKNTHILSKSKIIFSEKITKLKFSRGVKTALLYPNNGIAYLFIDEDIPARTIAVNDNDTAGTAKNIKTDTKENTFLKTAPLPLDLKNENDTDNNEIAYKNNDSQNNSGDILLGAAVSSLPVGGSKNKNFYKWLFVLIGLIFISTGGVLFIKGRETEFSKNISDTIHIIEE